MIGDEDPAVRRAIDEEHLRLLRIGYLVSAAMSAFLAAFPLLYVAFGVVFVRGLLGSFRSASDVDPTVFGWIFVALGLSLFVLFAGNAVFKLAAARAIARRRSHTFCLVAAAVTMLGIPWGTVLGIFSFLVLERPSVKALFTQPGAPSPPPAAPRP